MSLVTLALYTTALLAIACLLVVWYREVKQYGL